MASAAVKKNNSGKLFDSLLHTLHLKNDAALARLLAVAPPVISKVRHGRSSMSPALILLVHEKTGMPVADIRTLIAAA